MHPKDLEDIVKRIRGRLCHIDVAWITTDIKDALLGADNPSGANTFLTEENLNNYLSQDIIDALEAAITASGSNRYATMLDLMGIEPGTLITVVANYAAFPLPSAAVGKFFWAEASQGIPYTPDWFGGTYYGKGMYYSNGVTWEPIPVPFQATQAEVNTGVNNDRFVTPLTLKMSTQWDGVVLLAGRSGGQTLIGGTQITDALTLQGTSGNGTLTDKGVRILVGNNGATEAITVLNNGNVGVGVTAPASALHIQQGTTGDLLRINNASNTSQYFKIEKQFNALNIFRAGTLTTGIQFYETQLLGFYVNNFSTAKMTLNSESLLLTPNPLTGSSATSALSITQTLNTTGNPIVFNIDITNTASGATTDIANWKVNGVSQFRVSKAGVLNIVGNIIGLSGDINNFTNIRVSSGGSFTFGSGTRSVISSPANGNILFQNAALTDFNTLQFGGTTSAFPALQRDGVNFAFKLADNSDYTSFQDKYNRFGSGSPEGVVTAPIGAIYHRTDGGLLSSLYVKESGAGNTGWVAK